MNKKRIFTVLCVLASLTLFGDLSWKRENEQSPAAVVFKGDEKEFTSELLTWDILFAFKADIEVVMDKEVSAEDAEIVLVSYNSAKKEIEKFDVIKRSALKEGIKKSNFYISIAMSPKTRFVSCYVVSKNAKPNKFVVTPVVDIVDDPTL